MICKFVKSKNKYLKFEIDSEIVKNKVIQNFSTMNPNYRYSKFASMTVSPITPLGSFPAGMVYDICLYIKQNFPQIEFDFSNVKDIIAPFSYSPEKLVNPENETFKYFDYQEQSIRLGLKYGRGVFELATSAGKSLVIYGLIKNIWECKGKKTRCLLLVPNIQLLEQFQDNLIEFGCSPDLICKFGKVSPKFEDKPIVISNRSWLQGHAKELPDDFGIIMIDEVHQISIDNKVTAYVKSLSTNSKFGFTGTVPDKVKDMINHYSVIGTCGKILQVKKAKELQESGAISNLKIVTVLFEHQGKKQPEPPDQKLLKDERTGKEYLIDLTEEEKAQMCYHVEWKYVEDIQKSNQIMVELCLKLEKNSIILFDHTEHGKKLFDLANLLNKSSKKICFINGETKLDIREDIKAEMEVANNVILIGNAKCVGTGISIKNIHNIVFCFTSAKSGVKVLQAIGRGLRKLEGKTHMTLYDFYHSFRYSTTHFEERMKLYNENYKIDQIKHRKIIV